MNNDHIHPVFQSIIGNFVASNTRRPDSIIRCRACDQPVNRKERICTVCNPAPAAVDTCEVCDLPTTMGLTDGACVGCDASRRLAASPRS